MDDLLREIERLERELKELREKQDRKWRGGVRLGD
jgi:hypothetical protein